MLERARRKGDRSSELTALLGMCTPLASLGRWDEAVRYVEEAQAAEELEAMKWAAIRVIEVVPIQVRRGDVQGARHAFDVAKERADSRNYETRTRLGSIEVELLSAEGRHAEALAVAQQLLDALPKLGLPDVGVKRVIAHGVAAALELGELEAADAMLAIVRQARPGLVSRELRGHVAHLDARLSALRGNHDAAEAGFETAIAMFRDLGMPFEQGKSLYELAESLDGQGRSDEAATVALEARTLFERLGAQPWLERVRPLIAAASALPLAGAQS